MIKIVNWASSERAVPIDGCLQVKFPDCLNTHAVCSKLSKIKWESKELDKLTPLINTKEGSW